MMLVPAADQRVRFALTDRRRVPEMPGCYALASFDEEILYVGLAKSLRRRFCEHREDNSKRQTVEGVKAAWFHFTLCTESKMMRIERGWMNLYKSLHDQLPPMNKVYSPVV
jgi:excinuclease UvrABC nuclease subunit